MSAVYLSTTVFLLDKEGRNDKPERHNFEKLL
jgi:hypothetical protein